MVKVNNIEISPPIVNSSCAWSSDFQQLEGLYDSPYTGGVTTRTATACGFKEDDEHTVKTSRHPPITTLANVHVQVVFTRKTLSTLNSYGYSPHSLTTYLAWVESILLSRPSSSKPFIISITASQPNTLQSMVASIQAMRMKVGDRNGSRTSRVAIELNTSCPNIQNSSPSGYFFASLSPLLDVLAKEYAQDSTLTIGLKLPPFVFREQFLAVLDTLKRFTLTINHATASPFSFLTCTNTLGNSLMFPDQLEVHPLSPPAEIERAFGVPTALGGLAGDSLHALSLGNVYAFSQLLRAENCCEAGLGNLKIFGVGGVTSHEALLRMRRAGAEVVGCATLLGKEGLRAFEILAIAN
jgi:dihydroorotate dehydrogenase (fumarate)